MIDPRQSSFMNSAKVQIWCFYHYLCFVKSLPLLWFLQELLCWVNVSEVLFLFSVDFIEARTERKKTIVKDENSIYWKGFWKKGTRPLYPCCFSIDQKLWSLDIEGEKYIDNLWEVVKYKKKNQTSHFYQAPEKLQIVNHTTFFLLICRLIQKNGSKKEKKFNLLHCCVKKQDPW